MQNTLNRNTAKLNNLYILAEKNNIPIDENCPAQIVSMSLKLKDGTKIIGISDVDNSEYTKLELVAHEMGHCITDSFYVGYSPFELRAKYERRADRWAVNRLVPFRSLCRAVEDGYRELWELAEYFDVSCQFIEKAIKMYEQKGNVVPPELYTAVND